MRSLPNSNARILKAVEDLDYFDTQSVALNREVTPLHAWNTIMQDPQPLLKWAFKIRDAVSARFGVKRIGGFSGVAAPSADVGTYLDFFLVEHADTDTLVLTERDRHLDVMTCISTRGPTVSITSSVSVHNWFGRLYMIPVGIAHRWIVRGMLRRLKRKVR
ncbi:MAG: DUF2867 domain-containing protein [Pseudomonadota bacterium]